MLYESAGQNMWNKLSDIDEFQSILKQSKERPQLIYKHSPSCSVSFLSKQDLDANGKKLTDLADLHIVNVIGQRELSNTIASELNIRHESPQGFLIKDGEVVWHGSHWQVNAEKILVNLN